jgi:thiamine transport system substrate-binding protein
VLDSCVQQVEYAGVLANADHPEAARRFIDFLLSDEVQADLPLTMYVFPVVDGTPLPDVFQRFAPLPPDPIVVDPFAFGATRDDVIGRWNELVLG